MSAPDLAGYLRRYVRRGNVALSAGGRSDWYVDVQAAMLGYAMASRWVARAIAREISAAEVQPLAVGGPGIGGALLAAALLALTTDGAMTGFVVHAKPDRNGQMVVGEIPAGGVCVIVDDVATTGRALAHAIEAVRQAGGIVALAVVVVDREEGAREAIEALGVPFRALVSRADLLTDD